MKRVMIESPFRSPSPSSGSANGKYLVRAVKDSLARGEAPFASHGFYTLFLDDSDPEQRARGMEAGWAWMAGAQLVAVYTDLGISAGMKDGIVHAKSLGIPVEYRTLGHATTTWETPMSAALEAGRA